MLSIRYEFPCFMTFPGLELAISCFKLWHLNFFAICYDNNRSIK